MGMMVAVCAGVARIVNEGESRLLPRLRVGFPIRNADDDERRGEGRALLGAVKFDACGRAR